MRFITLTTFMFLAHCCIVGAKEPATGQGSIDEFFRAIRIGDIEAVSMAVDRGIDVNSSQHGLTAWVAAKQAGFDEIVNLLASRGAKPTTNAPAVGDALTAFMSTQFAETTPACAVLVSRDGKILAKNAYGMADIEQGVAATVETRFLIGSVTKQFTAAAILKLQEDGQLSVYDKLSKFLPAFPRGEDVTLHHLLTHTSGIMSYTSKPDFMATVTEPTTEVELIDSFKNDPFDFEPGEKYAYCNSGYFLLGHIVGKVTKTSLGEYLQKTFFEPLNMTSSGIYSTELKRNNQAKGYSILDDEIEPARVWHMSRAGGAGAIYSTVGDLFKWNEAIFNGKALSEKSLAAAFKPTKLNDGTISDYGYGWQLGQYRGLKTIQHSGGLDGFVSNVVRYPDQNVTVVALVNAAPTGDLPAPPSTTSNVGEYVLWEQMESRRPRVVDKSVDPKTFTDLVGRYDYGSSLIMQVTLEENQLYAQLTGQKKHPIYPESDSTFIWRIVEAKIQFVKDDDGNVLKGIHTQGGRTFDVVKIEEVKTIDVADEKLDEYVGRYDYGILAGKMIVSRDGKKLMAKLRGQPRLEIVPVAEDEFRWIDVIASIKFVRNQDGEIIHGLHRQGGKEITAPRVQAQE